MALLAIVTHLWVNLVVAPWHHLVEHRLPSLQSAASSESTELKSSKCSCRHHAHKGCDDATVTDRSSQPTPVPAAPHHDADECQICHVLAQAFMSSAHPVQHAAPERLEFSPPESAVQLWLESTLDPVSRGPPVI